MNHVNLAKHLIAHFIIRTLLHHLEIRAKTILRVLIDVASFSLVGFYGIFISFHKI